MKIEVDMPFSFVVIDAMADMRAMYSSTSMAFLMS
jgi:hypothetical protein